MAESSRENFVLGTALPWPPRVISFQNSPGKTQRGLERSRSDPQLAGAEVWAALARKSRQVMWRSIGLAAVLVLPPALLFSANLDAAGYMDEVFHMPQTQALCKGDFASWNPKITTLPGLYYASLVLLPAANIIARVAEAFLNLGGITTPALPEGVADARVLLLDRRLSLACSGRELRLVNVLLAVLLAATFHRILELLHGPQAETGRLPHRLRVAVLVLFPVQFFFYFLFYTDTVGSLMVLAMYERTILAVCLANVGPGVWRQAHVLYSAAACGAAAVLCRQTNVVWVVFCGGSFVINRIENAFPLPTATALTVRASHLIRHLMSQKGLDLAREVGPLVFVVFGFIVFVLLNGGVAVGDKSNHQAGFHPLQPCYWLLLLLFLLMPWTVSLARLRTFLQVTPCSLLNCFQATLVLLPVSASQPALAHIVPSLAYMCGRARDIFANAVVSRPLPAHAQQSTVDGCKHPCLHVCPPVLACRQPSLYLLPLEESDQPSPVCISRAHARRICIL